jgi:uncharacterized tellurite resistance protein B-like protein
MILSEEQKTLYLANVIHLARADSVLSPEETETLETVQKAIGARKTELNKAHKLAERDDFQPQPVGHWTDKIKNLEHMLYVAMVDGRIGEQEKAVALAFAKQVSISQEQLNLILKDVTTLVRSAPAQARCPACQTGIDPAAKFCPECGAAIGADAGAGATVVSYDIPARGVAIEFAESTAAGFGDALRDQQAAPVNATCVKAKKTWYLAAWPTEQVGEALSLATNLKGIRNRKVHVDGQEARWDDVFGFAWCAQARQNAYRPNEYCFGLDEKRFNLWGCKQARMDWNAWADWLGYGEYRKSGPLGGRYVFVFDKARIRHELEAALYACRFCPHLRFKLIEAVLGVWPDQVTPGERGPWTFKRDYRESPGSILVKVKRSEDGYSFTEEHHSSGVAPTSIAVGMDILRAAFQRIQYPPALAKGILEYKG